MTVSCKADKILVCKHCGETVGRFYSQLDEHLWIKHPEVMFAFLIKQTKGRKLIQQRRNKP